MTREEAARIYLNGLMDKDIDIREFFEAARVLSAEDKRKIQMALEKTLPPLSSPVPEDEIFL